MKDILGQDLNVGDIFLANHKKYSHLIFGIISSFTPQKIKGYFYSELSNYSFETYFTDWQVVLLEEDKIQTLRDSEKEIISKLREKIS